MRTITTEDGRSAFGADATNYDSARPEYPARLYEILRRRCGLGLRIRTFEIGPGTGLATRQLLKAGASVTAIEPDERLAAKLRECAGDPPLRIINATFEAAELAAGAFDLGASATAFHWMDQHAALQKVATVLKPGRWWAAWWNVFGDPERDDPFHNATTHLFQASASPSYSSLFKHPFALHREARIADLIDRVIRRDRLRSDALDARSQRGPDTRALRKLLQCDDVASDRAHQASGCYPRDRRDNVQG